MENFSITYLQNELLKSSRRNLFLFLLCVTSIAIGAVATIFFFVKLNESRPVINCGSFSSYGSILVFVEKHPEYKNRLDGGFHNGKYCEKQFPQQASSTPKNPYDIS